MIKKNLFKKLTVLTMVGIMSLSMVACGDEKEEKTTREAKTTEDLTITVEDTEEVTEEDTEEDTTEEDTTEEDTTEEVKDDKPTPSSNADFSSDDWKTLEFSLDGIVVTFPISYEEFKELSGFSIEEEYESETLEPNMYTTSVRATKDNGEQIYIRFKNFTDSDKIVKDCDIYGFGIETEEYLDVNPTFELCNGIAFGSSIDDIKAAMGEPDYFYENDEKTRQSLDYYVTGKSYESTISFSISEGVLNDVSIENVD